MSTVRSTPGPPPIAIRELAPGNYFYVDAHRMRIDAVDNGTEHEPAHCDVAALPVCGLGDNRCRQPDIRVPSVRRQRQSPTRSAPDGAAHAGGFVNRTGDRPLGSSDDTEDRDASSTKSSRPSTSTPDDITPRASPHRRRPSASKPPGLRAIRYFNLGLHGSRAAQSRTGPDRRHRSARPRCSPSAGTAVACSASAATPGTRRPESPPGLVQGPLGSPSAEVGRPRCSVHELVTEAVRILLPVAEFEAIERLASFKAALCSGCEIPSVATRSISCPRSRTSRHRAETGRPEPVRRRSRHRSRRNRLPARLADPDRLQEILKRAVELIATCDCQTQGQARLPQVPLHRRRPPRDPARVPRRRARRARRDPHRLATRRLPRRGRSPGSTSPKCASPSSSGCSRSFYIAGRRRAPARLTATRSDHADRVRFDMRFQDGPHWEIREQVNLPVHATIPGLLRHTTRSVGAAPVAIYLDGWEYHGADPDQVDKDSEKRASLRAAGIGVWTLTWPDVKAALNAANQKTPVAAILPISNAARSSAMRAAKQLAGGEHPAFAALGEGAFEQLMRFLRHPEDSAWNSLAQGTAIGPAQQVPPIYVPDANAAIQQAGDGAAITEAAEPTGIAAITWVSQGECPCVVLVEDEGPPVPTAVLSLDTNAEADKARWSDWLHLGNILQHMGDRAMISSTRTFLPSLTATAAPESTGTSGDSDLEDLLADVFDPAAATLARVVAAKGWRGFVVGYASGDVDDTPIEVAWPDQKVGILATGGQRPRNTDEWDLRNSDQWTPEQLISALELGAS